MARSYRCIAVLAHAPRQTKNSPESLIDSGRGSPKLPAWKISDLIPTEMDKKIDKRNQTGKSGGEDRRRGRVGATE